MDIPNHLNHKPIVKLENYLEIDGPYANNSDAQGLSIGLAQWNDANSNEIELSAKVWRYTGKKWSRQSEELPIHRVFDLASLACSAISFAQNNILLSDDKFSVNLSRDSKLIENLKNSLIKNDKKLDDHLNESLVRLSKMLKQLGY